MSIENQMAMRNAANQNAIRAALEQYNNANQQKCNIDKTMEKMTEWFKQHPEIDENAMNQGAFFKMVSECLVLEG